MSEPEFTAAVDRLAVAGAQNVQQNAAPIISLVQSPLPGPEYDSCGSTRSDTDSGRDLVIASDTLAIGGDVACNTVVTILGEGTNLPGCIVAGVLHVASQATQFELDLRSYCDSVIDANEIRGILANHDDDIKAALAILQKNVDEANQRLKVSEAGAPVPERDPLAYLVEHVLEVLLRPHSTGSVTEHTSSNSAPLASLPARSSLVVPLARVP